MVVIMNSWIVTMYPSAPWKLICSTCHSFPFLFRLPRTWLLWATRRVFLEKQRTLTLPMHLVHVPSFNWSLCKSLTFVNLYMLFCVLFFVRVCFPFWPLSLDYIFFYFRWNLDYPLLNYMKTPWPVLTKLGRHDV